MKYLENNNSIWLAQNENKREFRSLDRNIEVDVAIIGGGITGISCAYYLSKHGLKVAVLEKDRICSKTSGGTTGKITSQHHLFYQYLISSQGKEFAKKYWKAAEKSIDNIEKIIQEENIDCDFERKSSFVWTKDLKELHRIQDEVQACKSLGINAKLVDTIEVLGKIEGAIEFPNQAQFQPVKYVQGLTKCVLEKGGEIFENTKVVDYEKADDGFMVTAKVGEENRKVRAKYLVVATRYPIFNVPGFHFLKMYQELEYGIALKADCKLNGMYVSCEVPTISFRDYQNKNGNYILVVGNGHKTGESQENKGFDVLEQFAKQYFPEKPIEYRWNAEDCIGLDKIPYIGEYSEVRENMYVATGFKKWGMTTSNIAANLITDKILGKENPYEEVFKATRLEPIKNGEEMKNMLKEVGESVILPHIKGEKDKKYCAHLGCEVSWNDVTQTWDCPCHGSRYEKDGTLIEGPAVHGLNQKDKL